MRIIFLCSLIHSQNFWAAEISSLLHAHHISCECVSIPKHVDVGNPHGYDVVDSSGEEE